MDESGSFNFHPVHHQNTSTHSEREFDSLAESEGAADSNDGVFATRSEDVGIGEIDPDKRTQKFPPTTIGKSFRISFIAVYQ